ncbi:MAG: hypothetical protein AB1505_09070 [Candidatus Latescibacterota bacterium]
MWRTAAVFLLSASTVLAASLYVDVNNPQGYATIPEALRRAQAGDVIYISAGFYVENVSLEKKVSLIGEGADRVTLTAGTADGITVGGTVDSTVHIEGMTIAPKAGRGVALYNGGGITLRSCTIRGGVQLSSSISVLQHCRVSGGVVYC